jgi:hypothetical protein
MRKSRTRTKRPPKRILALPDLEHAKIAVLNSLTSASAQRTYDHAIRAFVAWYCSEPPSGLIARSFSAIAFTSNCEDTRQPQSTSAWPRFGELRTRLRTRVC